MSYSVQFLRYSSRGGYICYPKVVANDRTWDSRSASNWSHWTLAIGIDIPSSFLSSDMIPPPT